VTENLNAKTAIITGATGNLGQSIARLLHESGVRLALIDRGVGRLTDVYPGWGDSSQSVFLESIDLTDAADVSRAVMRMVEVFGRIDVIINAAGGYRSGKPLHETTDQDWTFLMDLNAHTVLNVCRAVIPIMLQQGSGKIINIAARSGLKGTRQAAAYAVSKSAVLRMTESMSAELKHNGINVNAIIPGTIDTPANRELMPDADFEKWVNPDEISKVIRFLISDDADAIHGALLPVYGRG
jgi:NAD(P)-dependent dehydrogenase (short-subunit alcohol dehydrogenase family)